MMMNTTETNPHLFNYHLGVDWGAMGLRVAVTRPLFEANDTLSSVNPQPFSAPEIFHYQDGVWFPLTGIRLPNNRSLVGPQSYHSVTQDAEPGSITVYEGYIDWLAANPEAANEVEGQAVQWLREITHTRLTVEDATTSLTVLRGGHTPAVALHQAGFENVFSRLASEAALKAHRVAGRLSFEPASTEVVVAVLPAQHWAVIDFGARELRCAVVEYSQRYDPREVDCRFLPYGGCMIDDVIAAYVWEHNLQEQQNTPYSRFLVINQLRDAKERAFGRPDAPLPALNLVLKLPEDQMIPVVIDADSFDKLCRAMVAAWAEEAAQVLRNMTDTSIRLRGIILTGGTACLAVVQDVFTSALSGLAESPNLITQDADRCVAFGLALAQANALTQSPIIPAKLPMAPANSLSGQPLPAKSQPVQTQSGGQQNSDSVGTRKPADPPGSQRLKYRAQARSVLRTFILIGALIALLLSPIPGASSPILVFLEVVMLYRIIRIYHLKINSDTLIWGVVALLGMSFLIKLVVVELMTLVPLLGWMIKPFTAGAVIWGLGEASIAFFEKQRYGKGT